MELWGRTGEEDLSIEGDLAAIAAVTG